MRPPILALPMNSCVHGLLNHAGTLTQPLGWPRIGGKGNAARPAVPSKARKEIEDKARRAKASQKTKGQHGTEEDIMIHAVTMQLPPTATATVTQGWCPGRRRQQQQRGCAGTRPQTDGTCGRNPQGEGLSGAGAGQVWRARALWATDSSLHHPNHGIYDKYALVYDASVMVLTSIPSRYNS